MAKQYVQHISKQGEKWLIETEHARSWVIRRRNMETLVLPREEYVLCDPPERWTDVTAGCDAQPNGEIWHHPHGPGDTSYMVAPQWGYRIRKMQLDVPNGSKLAHTKQWAFLVKRKETA